MAPKSTLHSLKKNLLTTAACLALACAPFLSAGQVLAQGLTPITTNDPQTQQQAGATSIWAQIVFQVNQFFKAQGIDISNSNTRLTAAAKLSGDVAVKQTPSLVPLNPNGGSLGGDNTTWCSIAQGAADAINDDLDDAAVAQGLAQAQQRVQNPTTQAQELIAQQCNLFGSSSPMVTISSPGLPVDYGAKTTQALCPSGASTNPLYTHMDVSMESLMGPLQFSVIPNSVVLTAGIYNPKPISAMPSGNGPQTGLGSQASMMQYAAAMTYCQHISALVPIPPQPPASTSLLNAGVAAPAALLSIGPIIDASASASTAASTCYKFLSERMAYSKAADVGTRYEDQVRRCNSDFHNNIIDQPALDLCKQYGRSPLQARHDYAYRFSSYRYIHKLFGSMMSAELQDRSLESAKREQVELLDYLVKERDTLVDAIYTARSIQMPTPPLAVMNGSSGGGSLGGGGGGSPFAHF